MTQIVFIGIKLVGFLLGAFALEEKLNADYSTYLILYSLIGFLAFISEMGIYYSVSNQWNSNTELERKLGRIFLSSMLSMALGLLFVFVYIPTPNNEMVYIFISLPIIINLSLMFRGILIKESVTILPAAYDAFAFGAPGYLFFFLIDSLNLSTVCTIIVTSHLGICIILYFHVKIIRKIWLIPKCDFSISPFEKNMLLSNVVASPLGHVDLWLLLYLIPDVASKVLLVRDLASKIPNLFFPFLQIYLYPKMIAEDDRINALKVFYRTSTFIILNFSGSIILFQLLNKHFTNSQLLDIASYFPIILFFVFRTVGSFLAPLMMYERRSDLSLLRNAVHSFLFVCFGAVAYFVVTDADAISLYFGYIIMQIILTLLDVIITKKLVASYFSPYTFMYMIFNVVILFHVCFGLT